MPRPLEEHLTAEELEALFVSGEHGGVSVSACWEHLRRCELCRAKESGHREREKRLAALRSNCGGVPTAGCPPEQVWAEIAAQAASDSEASAWLGHAGQCDYCGTILREHLELFSDDIAGDERRIIESLSSSNPLGRARLARRMARTRTHWAARLKSHWRGWAYAAAAVAVVAALGMVLWRWPHPDIAKLPLLAYSESRTIELRFSGAPYGPLKQQRGAAVERSSAWLEAEAAVTRRAAKEPAIPEVLEAKARLDLLAWQFEPAIDELERALDLQPASPALLIDLACAHYERAEAEGADWDYGVAVDLLGKVLQRNPDPAALFNRALLYERIGLVQQAIQDWKRYLEIDPANEPTKGWSGEARAHLSALIQKKISRDRSMEQIVQSPVEFLKIPAPEVVASAEEYLDIALRRWLVEASPEAGAALGRLAVILQNEFHDRWLKDLLSSNGAGAMRVLAEAISLNEAGQPVEAESEARRAMGGFWTTGNAAGTLRARLEIVYALNRRVEGGRCLAEAAGLERELRSHEYPLEFGKFLLDRSTCAKMTGDFAGASRDIATVLRLTGGAAFPVLRLRALGVDAAMQRTRGNARSAWASDRAGLLLYWAGVYPPLREHQFCSDLGFLAQQMKLWHLAVALGDESAGALAATSNRTNEAVARYVLASAAEMAGMKAKAETEYRNAMQLFQSVPQDSAVETDLSYCRMHLAAMQASRGDLKSAAVTLQSLQSAFVSETPIALAYHSAAGYVSLSRGEAARAAEEFATTLDWATRAGNSLRGESDRLRWQNEVTGIYRGLARAQSALGRPDDAARTWLIYLAGFREPIPSIPQVASLLSRDTLLWYVQYEDGIAIRMLDNRGLRSYWSAVPQEVFDAAATRFANSCARPSADLGSLRKQGQQLYRWLILPAENDLDGNRTILIATDRAVSQVPFQALRGADGEYFGARYAVARASAVPAVRAQGVNSHERALIAGTPLVGTYAASFPPLPDAVREMAAVSKYFDRPVLLSGNATNGERIRREWLSATVFHFAGHTVANPGLGGLVLSAREDGPEILEAASFRADSLNRCKLAVLSTCDSALGETRQAIDPDSLVEGLLRTGIHTVVASRWKVDSRATAAYMKTFYEALLGGAPVPGAIRAAASNLRDNPETQHPYYWAAFDSYSRELP